MAAQLALLDLPDYGDAQDFYSTPKWAAKAIEPLLMDAVAKRDWRMALVEPAAGEGALVPTGMRINPSEIALCEINPERHRALCDGFMHFRPPILGDFLKLDFHDIWPHLSGEPLCFLLNPPFTKPRPTIGREFVERCLELATPLKGIVCALLPLDWATGVEWSKIHDRYPGSLYPLRRRPEFDGAGTGMRPCAWYLWDLMFPERNWRVVG